MNGGELKKGNVSDLIFLFNRDLETLDKMSQHNYGTPTQRLISKRIRQIEHRLDALTLVSDTTEVVYSVMDDEIDVIMLLLKEE